MATSATSATNIDVTSIVNQLMTVERQPIKKLDIKEAGYQAKLSAYGSVKGAVASFQTAVQSLNSVSKFQAVKATPSDSTVFSASASSIAVAGAYSLEVTSLAQAQKLVTAGQTSSTAAVGTGTATTLSFDFGTIAGSTLFNSTTGKYGATLSGATAAGTSVTVVSTANLAVGNVISGHDYPAGTTITSIDSGTTFTTSAPPATDSGGLTLQAGATFTSSGSGIKTVTIDSTNNSLQGIRDAINAAGIGVTATIINDGSASPYRLALSSNSNGVSNSMKVSVSGDAAVGTLLAHDPANNTGQNLSETVTAQNANFKVNGVAVSKTSNTVSDVVQGVILTLSKVTTSPVTLTVARDTASVSSSISGFVKAYNDLAKMLKDVSAYDAASKKGAILQGDSTVRSLQSQIRSMLGTSVVGTSGALTTLSSVGVSFQKDGTLALNQTKLDSAIANNFSDIAGLFAATGKATDSLVGYASATGSTKAGSYAVDITQIAAKGGVTGDLNLSDPAYTIDPGTTVSVALDGAASLVALTAGSYTPAQLAAMIQSAINGTSTFSSAGLSVAATISGGLMNIVSNQYGLTSNVSISSGAGTAVSTFMGTVTTGAAGKDVAGSIGGVAATGSGQTLNAAGGDALGLSISVNGGATGARGTINYSHGYAYLLDQWAASNLASGGSLAGRLDGIGRTITDIGKQRTALENRLVSVEKRYRAQFSNLDAMLSSMNQTSTYLTQQLEQLSNL
jgi:flagellar hook-associated protein 2